MVTLADFQGDLKTGSTGTTYSSSCLPHGHDGLCNGDLIAWGRKKEDIMDRFVRNEP